MLTQNLGSVFLAKGASGMRLRNIGMPFRITPDNVAAQSNLAWLLATAADPPLRNGSEAVLLAERAESESSGAKITAIVLRILAAAYAETGRLLTLRKLLKRLCKRQRWRVTPHYSSALRSENLAVRSSAAVS